jgi:hypothetical protein
MNSNKCEELDKNDITSEIKKKEISQECNIIGNKKKRHKKETDYFRICIKCNKNVFYSNKGNLINALKEKRQMCSSCSKTVHDKHKIYSNQCKQCKNTIVYSCYTTYYRNKKTNPVCKKCAITKFNESRGTYKRNCPTCNIVIIHKTKSIANKAIKKKRLCLSCSISKKNRIRHIQYRKTHGRVIVPCFNHNACLYFGELNIQNNWKLIHAKNGGEFHIKELGFYIDAYDKEKNIVVEYDEPHHYDRYGNLRKKDVDRMNEIQHHLQCEFWRYNEKTKTLKRYK